MKFPHAIIINIIERGIRGGLNLEWEDKKCYLIRRAKFGSPPFPCKRNNSLSCLITVLVCLGCPLETLQTRWLREQAFLFSILQVPARSFWPAGGIFSLCTPGSVFCRYPEFSLTLLGHDPSFMASFDLFHRSHLQIHCVWLRSSACEFGDTLIPQ